MLLKLKRTTLKILYRLINWRLDKFLNYRFEKKRFLNNNGYPLDLKNPESFSEKIVWKKLNDRNPLLPLTTDKYLVRSYVKKVLGTIKADEILIPLLYVTDHPETIPFEILNQSYIIKPNHGSGYFIIIESEKPDRKEIIRKCYDWLNIDYGLKQNEWAYKQIKRKIIIEKLLKDKNGKFPRDYKFHVFHGKCHLIYVTGKKFEKESEKIKVEISTFTPRWEYIDVKYHYKQGPPLEKPKNLQDMIMVAEKLAAPFDFVRVDMYSISGKTYFGELTHYPFAGCINFKPADFNCHLGKYWNIKANYWKDNKLINDYVNALLT